MHERHGLRFGLARTLATLLATLHVVRRFRLTPVRLEQAGQTVVRTTPFVLVGNNEYSMLVPAPAPAAPDHVEVTVRHWDGAEFLTALVTPFRRIAHEWVAQR